MRIKGKRYKVKKATGSNNLCYKCKKAAGGCAWSRSFDPVDGWTAEPVEPNYRGSYESNPNMMKTGYHITACPEFEED